MVFYGVNVDKPKYKSVVNPDTGHHMFIRTDQKHVAIVDETESGQCMTVDASSILPADKTGFRAILVLRPYILDLMKHARESRE